MAVTELEERMTRLEAEVEALKRERANGVPVQKPWWEEIRGTFKDDPAYVEAMRLGREWRESQCMEYEDRITTGETNDTGNTGKSPQRDGSGTRAN